MPVHAVKTIHGADVSTLLSAFVSRRGVTTLTNAVSGQGQNCSGNLEISPGIGALGNFSGKHAIIPGHCRKKIGTSKEILFHVFI